MLVRPCSTRRGGRLVNLPLVGKVKNDRLQDAKEEAKVEA